MRFVTSFLALAGLLCSSLSQASTPASGTVSPGSLEQTYSAGPFIISDPGGVGCADLSEACDDFALTVDLPANYATTNPAAKIVIDLVWDPQQADLDLALLNAAGEQILSSGSAPGTPEHLEFPATQGLTTYTVRITAFVGGGATATGTITLVPGEMGSSAPPPVYVPTPFDPRYQVYTPPTPFGETSGEPSLGYNVTSKRAMYISGLQTLRATFPENLDPVQPEACEANWEDVSYIVTSTASLDPILYTDQLTGRTFVSQLNSQSVPGAPVLAGANSLFAYTDDDGASWTPGQIDAPNGSYDHQTVGAGPYPAPLDALLSNPTNKGSAVYYCSQVGVEALCARSDTGGLTFNRPSPVFLLDCGAIHGHLRVAPDGTAYLPNRSCGENQGVSISTDAGTTFSVSKIPTSSPPPSGAILDPSIALASDGSGYFCYINAQGRPHVAVTRDKGATWENDFDIGASQGIENSVFVEAIAGDPDRAACGFVGTTTDGNHQALDFPGVWYLFMAHTYDGGKTWVTVNATPGDPVQQAGGIWNQGGASPNRNLLDFNEITLDDKGFPLYSYADGCIGSCVPNGPNSYSEKANIARQRGGKSLYAAFDTPVAEPRQACLAGRRDDTGSFLRWREPDNGGASISAYKVFRSTAADGTYTQIGATTGKPAYNDRSADLTVERYFYKVTAVSALGEGALSNLVELPIGPRPATDGPCVLPGVLVVSAPTGDATIPDPAFDIQSVSIAEPQNLDGKIVFTLKMASLASVPNGFRWAVRFKPPMPPPPFDTGAPSEDFFVAMVSSDGPAPTFSYGYTGVPDENAPGRFFVTLGDLDPESTFAEDGTITMILDKANIGSPMPGDPLINVFGSVRASTPSALPGTGGVNQTIPDSTGGGAYTLRAANFCLVNTAPLAMLTASAIQVGEGDEVSFSGAGSTDADTGVDTIAKFAFNFGDGSEEIEQSTAVITHRFTQAGLYPVQLFVTDSRGKVSSNAARVLIEVGKAGVVTPPGSPGVGGATETGRFGGALGWLLLLPLAALGLRRRRG